jgi:dipeptidyl aminopeptidase/acylaminoacyl peptidase
MIAVLVIAAAAAALLCCVAVAVSRAVHRSPARTYRDRYFVTPFEARAPFEPVSFRSADGVTLRGWWLARPGNRVVLGCSGLDGNKADLIGIGPALWRAGNSVLLFDCRDRGESDPAPRSAGFLEALDVKAAVGYAGGRVPRARIGLLGYSMGAVACVMAAAELPMVCAVAADSAYASLEMLLASRLRRRHLPAGPILFLSNLYNRLAYGYSLSAVSPLDAVARISPRPLLVIHGGSDSVIPADHARLIFESAGEPKKLWVADGADHCGAYFADREVYCARVAEFFRKALGR